MYNKFFLLTIALIGAVAAQNAGNLPRAINNNAFGTFNSPETYVVLPNFSGGGALRGRFNFNIGFSSISRPGMESGAWRIDYEGITPAVVEIHDYNFPVQYQYCPPTCDTNSLNALASIPAFYRLPSENTPDDTEMVIDPVGNARMCDRYTRTGNNVQFDTDIEIFYTEQGTHIPCAAVARDGTEFYFNNAAQGLAAGQPFVPDAAWQCPEPTCTQIADIKIAIDESGSISSPDFQLELQFVVDLANQFTFGDFGVFMGMAAFASGSQAVVPITLNRNQFIVGVQGNGQSGGSTCLGCGLLEANGLIGNRVPQGIQQIILLLSDGRNNVGNPTSARNTIANQAFSTIIFTIGIGGNVDANELRGLTLNGGTFIAAASFTDLLSQVNSILLLTCTGIDSNPCGANCNGYCICNQQCICPTLCNDTMICTDDMCNPLQNGAGCFNTPRSCDDGDVCTTDSCDPAVLYPNDPCINDDIRNLCAACDSCVDSDPCTMDSCNLQTGLCQYIPVDDTFCDDQNACTTDFCDASNPLADPMTGCVNMDIICPDPGPCSVAICGSAVGCGAMTLDCNTIEPFAGLVGDCQAALCDPARTPNADGNSCFLVPFANATRDECGVCDGDGSTCSTDIGAGALGGIGVGGLVGIILAICCCLLCGAALGGGASFEYYRRNAGDFQAGDVNPLFKENPNSGNSPLYKE